MAGMANSIVDSSVVIDYLRGRTEACDFLHTMHKSDGLGTHVVVVAEVLSGASDQREQDAIDLFFREFRIYLIGADDSQSSVDLFKRFRLSHGVGWLDCLIAATAHRLSLPVVTLNEKHFAVFENLIVERPY